MLILWYHFFFHCRTENYISDLTVKLPAKPNDVKCKREYIMECRMEGRIGCRILFMVVWKANVQCAVNRRMKYRMECKTGGNELYLSVNGVTL